MSRLIHLNGLPGIGKSTLARRYAADHPGVLLCDIDVVRTMISGWQDAAEAAERSRTVGLAMTSAYLGTGRDVVVPQLVADPGQLARFAAAAGDAGSAYVHVMLTADTDVVARRFRARATSSDDEWTAVRDRAVGRSGWRSRLLRVGSASGPAAGDEARQHRSRRYVRRPAHPARVAVATRCGLRPSISGTRSMARAASRTTTFRLRVADPRLHVGSGQGEALHPDEVVEPQARVGDLIREVPRRWA